MGATKGRLWAMHFSRRAMRAYDALLVDAAGTLLHTREPVARVYGRFAASYGCVRSDADISAAFRRVMSEPWPGLRFEGRAESFWKHVVRESTGCKESTLFEALYAHYAQASTWQLAPGCRSALSTLRTAGTKLALVSNFDLRLRGLLEALEVVSAFDELVISAEVGMEKPDPEIFRLACERLGVSTSSALHVGDSRVDDVEGARAAGVHCWRFGHDVSDFAEVCARLTG